MWLAYETALRAALTDTIPGTPVFGTVDAPSLEAPAQTYIQVAYLGYKLAAQAHSRTAAFLDEVFTVRIAVAAATVDATQLSQLDAGLTEIARRLLAFTYGTGPAAVRPQLIDSPPPQWVGGAGELAIYFTLRKKLPQ
jgi:hypothetical protein